MVQKILGKSDIPKETKGGRKKRKKLVSINLSAQNVDANKNVVLAVGSVWLLCVDLQERLLTIGAQQTSSDAVVLRKPYSSDRNRPESSTVS